MRGATFQALALALGVSSSGLRRWARRGRIPGAMHSRGRWILRGPLTQQRVEKIREGLNLNPIIATGRRGENPPPVFSALISWPSEGSRKEQAAWDERDQQERKQLREDQKRFSELARWEHEAPGKEAEMTFLQRRLFCVLSSTEKRLTELEGLEGLTDTEMERRTSILRNRIKQIKKTISLHAFPGF